VITTRGRSFRMRRRENSSQVSPQTPEAAPAKTRPTKPAEKGGINFVGMDQFQSGEVDQFPSVDTSNPASRGQVKTGQLEEPGLVSST
jgi:hypothetical protein